MDNVSSINAPDLLHVYYKVALKAFTNSCVRQVVNRHLLRGLENVFSPEEAAGWEDAKVRMVAAEPMNITNLRAQLEVRKASLEHSRVVLRNSRLRSRKSRRLKEHREDPIVVSSRLYS
jgi:hypothetical protein